MPSWSPEEDEIVRCGLSQCEDWHSFLSYCRFMKPAMKYHASQRLAARLWIEIKKRRQALATAAAAGPPPLAHSGCWGCREAQPNQLAHMEPGGCLYQAPLEED